MCELFVRDIAPADSFRGHYFWFNRRSIDRYEPLPGVKFRLNSTIKFT
jgi:hypothetical protein